MSQSCTSRKSMAKCVRNNLMHVLFLFSFVISLVHIGRHLVLVENFFSAPSFEWIQTQNESTTTTTTTTTTTDKALIHTASAVLEADTTTWALVTPPGLLGGYRNQVIRLFGMVIGATQQNVKQFLLPSILWSTVNQNDQMRTVPMEDLFDIDHWNSFRERLPRLVDNIQGGDCWYPDRESMLEENKEFMNHLLNRQDAPLMERILHQPRFLKPIANTSLAYATGELEINPRRFDVSPQVQNCTHPVAYGAGGGRGILWVNYMQYNQKRPRTNAGAAVPNELEKTFLQALRPSQKWRNLAQQCVEKATRDNQNPWAATVQNTTYIALHPRIELEMMTHTCGSHMNKNLTKILEDVQVFIEQNEAFHNVSGIFAALSRSGASVREGRPYRRFRAFVDGNIETMERVLGSPGSPGQGLDFGGDKRSLPVFECGEQLVQEYYKSQSEQPTIDYGSLLPSIINFEVAVEAAVFIGFRFSSWSNSVWTTRYYLGKGDTNFEYTRERGIQQVNNGGLPPPHQNCDGIKDPGR